MSHDADESGSDGPRSRLELEAREREVAHLARLYAALSQVNQAIVWMPTREDLFHKVCRVLVESGGFRMAWIGWHEPGTHRLVPVAEHGDDTGYLRGIEVRTDSSPEGSGPSGTAFRTGRPYVDNDLGEDSANRPWRPQRERRGFQASAAFPIRSGGEVRGTLNVYAGERGYFGAAEATLLEESVAAISFALDGYERESARLQAERTLRSEKLFSDVMIESMPGILYFYDEEGHFLRWNRNFETVSGCTREEIASRHPLDFHTPEQRPRVEERIAEVFALGESAFEADFVAKDGTATPYFFTGRRVPFEERSCLVGVGIDVSDRRRAEARIAESERQYRELVENANSIILRWNAEGRVTFLNEFGQRFFGYTAEEIVGCHVIGTIVPTTESGGRDLDELMAEICAAPESFAQNENENIRRDGERVRIAWTNRIVRDAEGRVVEILSIGTDVTARLQIEAERQARHRAEAADHIKSAFLATMSHELRTPLNAIIGFTGIVLQGLAGPLNAEQSKQLDMVRASARHLLALVNDVLDISKIEAGQLEISCRAFDPRRSIAKVIELVAPQAEAKRLALRTVVAPDLPAAIGDERRFEQILLNLLSNAIKFTEEGEVALSAELVPGRPGAERPLLRVRVSDTGPGIRPEDLPKLFQPFRQLDTGLARQHDGTGLGLAICRRLAELMGG
ncbi:MAG: PAS domain S-box protein, partial [Thermoanaerobaculia bacterium]|nr:PAS domain S-box protein [Thermoanaerobaculia bacterium]